MTDELSPTEKLLYIRLMEECAEVTQICSKILRFGRNSFHPDDPNKTTNDELLSRECADLDAITATLVRIHNFVSDAYVDQYNKKTKQIHKMLAGM
jgi:hypothetical protein